MRCAFLLVVALSLCSASDEVEIEKIQRLHPTSTTVYQRLTELRSFLSAGMLSHLVTCPDQFACILKKEGQTIGLLQEASAFLHNGMQLIFMPVIEDTDQFTGLWARAKNGTVAFSASISVAHRVLRENVLNTYHRYGPNYDKTKLFEFVRASFREVIASEYWEFWEANASTLDNLLADDIQKRFATDTVTNITVSVLSLDNGDRSLSKQREQIAQLTMSTRFHEVEATKNAAESRTAHQKALAEAQLNATVSALNTNQTLNQQRGFHIQEKERLEHEREVANIKNEQAVAYAKSQLEIAQLNSKAKEVAIKAEWGSYEGYLSVARARTMSDALGQCPHTVDMKMHGMKFLLNEADPRLVASMEA